MSHIERRLIYGRYYFYEFQSYRDKNGRVRKKFLRYLGSEDDHPELAKELEERSQKWKRNRSKKVGNTHKNNEKN